MTREPCKKLNFEPLRKLFENAELLSDSNIQGMVDKNNDTQPVIQIVFNTESKNLPVKRAKRSVADRQMKQDMIFGPQLPWMDIQNMIHKVVFNNPYTIILWKDGTKTKVKCCDNDRYDEMEGLSYAILKRICGNTNAYHEIFDKFLPAEDL